MKKLRVMALGSGLKVKKKVLALIGLIILIILLAVAFIFIDWSKELGNKESNSTTPGGLADDSEAALLSDFQPYRVDDSELKVKIYSENYGKIGSMALFDTCDSKLEKKGEEADKIGDQVLEKPNHCVLHFWGQSESAYILLPDGSLIAVDGSAVIQVNLFDKETRIVQTDGRGYYRIAKQPEGKKFTIQMGNQIFSATGTEIIAHAYQIPMADEIAEQSKRIDEMELTKEEVDEMLAPNWRIGFGVIEGKGEIFARDGSGEKLTASASNYFGFDFQEYGKKEVKKSSRGSIYNLTESIKSLAADYNERKSMYGNIKNYLESFLSAQIDISDKYYGIGKFNSLERNKTAEILDAYLYDFAQLSEVQLKEAERESAEFYKEWARLSETYDGSSSPGASYEAGDKSNQDSGSQPSSGYESKKTPTYFYSDSPSNSTSERCFNKGTASYQLFCGSSVGGGSVVGGKCCLP